MRKLKGITGWNIIQYILLGFLLFFSFVPIAVGILMSLKTTGQIYADFFGLPNPIMWSNYLQAFQKMLRPLINTLIIAFGSIFGGIVFSSLAAYAFARLHMFGKRVFFMLVLCLMMMPGVLTLTPSFILANQLHLRNTYSGLMLFYIGGAQAFSIFLLRTFFENQPAELFESVRIDGANEIQGLIYIALPLSHSILITIGIMNLLSYYNDLIFPMLMLITEAKQTLMIMLQKFNPASNETGRPEVSLQVASYIVATIPQLLVFVVGMKYYIQGITSGAIKG
jgi:ABC-type glycerol-3-phosphate transport system permease component